MPLLEKAIIAVECENSLWKSKKMPDYATEFSPQKRLGGKLGLKKTAVLPTVIIKEEDRLPLKAWQERNPVKFHGGTLVLREDAIKVLDSIT